MNPAILGHVIEVGIQSGFLAVALWIMIKLQKLEYNFPGLLGSAVFTCGLEKLLDLILEPSLGIVLASYISVPIVVVVLLACIAKVTRADAVDVIFTVGVGYALTFGMNLWLLGTLMGDLRPSARQAPNEPLGNVEVEHPIVVKTNRPAALIQATNQASGKNAAVGKSPAKNESANPPTSLPAARPGSSAPIPASSLGNPNGPVPAELIKETAKGFSLRGIIGSGKPSAMIYSGVKTYTVFTGDSLSMETANGRVTVRCEQLDKDKVVLNIGGEPVTLSVPGTAP